MTRMSCATVRRAIGPLHDSELAVDSQVPIEAHLAGCSACQAWRNELLSTI
jgi:predicted anti-sigma-YlaC factor YlaD